jgi:NAD(P)-dependent dehydrogenase (short-subunit alcohol dehydrogenase family)
MISDAEARHPGLEELTPEIWDRFFAIFVRAPVILTRAALTMTSLDGATPGPLNRSFAATARSAIL